MPLVASSSNTVGIAFEAETAKMIAESNRVIAQIEETKKATKEANKQIEADAKKAQEAAKKNTISWTDFRSAYSTVLDVVRAGQMVWDATFNTAVKYAGQVRDLALITQTGAEETSRFLQVLDDYELSAEDATAATKALKEKGLVPTIDTLADLADKYKEIHDPAEKMQFIQDNLGRGGAKWVNVLSQTGDELRKQAAEINKNNILTDQQVKEMEEARLAADAWADAIQGLKVQTGAFLGTQVVAITRYQETTELYKQLNPEVEKSGRYIGTYREEILRLAAQLERGKAMTEFYTQSLSDQSDVIDAESIPSIEELTKINQEYLSTVGSLTGEIEGFTKKEEDLTAKHAELLAEKQTLISQGWWAESKAVQDINTKLAENEAAQAENADAAELAGRRRILSMLEQQLAIDGLNARETTYLLETGLKWGVYSAEAVAAAQAAQLEVQKLTEDFNNIPEHKISTIDIYTNNYSSNATASGSANYVQQLGRGGFAGGGISTGSPSGHMEMLHGTEAVIPLQNGSVPVQMQNGGGVSMQEVLALFRTLPDEIARANRSMFEKVGRR